MTDAKTKIDQLESGFEAFGYIVMASAIPGEEDQWAETLKEGFDKLERHFAYNANKYGYRGRSKRALTALHKDMPEPTWGVEVAAKRG